MNCLIIYRSNTEILNFTNLRGNTNPFHKIDFVRYFSSLKRGFLVSDHSPELVLAIALTNRRALSRVACVLSLGLGLCIEEIGMTRFIYRMAVKSI
jgi:hypothetical protein